MRINNESLKNLLANEANGSYQKLGDMLGISRNHAHKVVNGTIPNAGPVFLAALISFCEKNGKDYKEYIFLS